MITVQVRAALASAKSSRLTHHTTHSQVDDTRQTEQINKNTMNVEDVKKIDTDIKTDKREITTLNAHK